MQIVWALFGGGVAISISTPFVNQYLQESVGLNLGFVYILSSLLAISIFALQCRKPINLKYFIFFCLLNVTFFINVDSNLTNGFVSVLIGLVLCLPFLQYNIPSVFFKSLVITLFLFACFFFLLITNDSRLLELIYLNTRMAMGNSPISIAIIAAISVLICTYHFSSVSGLKKIPLVFFIAFFIAAILYSGSRGPLLALFVILFLQLARSGKVIIISILSGFGGLSALFILSIRENHNDSSSSRINMYQEAFKIVSESPLGGFHIGKYTYLTGKPFPHNFFLEIWVDFNVFFLFLILSLTLYVMYQRYTTLHKKENITSNLVVDIYILIFICCQMSLPSTEMLRVLLPLLFISMCCISNEKLNVEGLK